VTLVTKPTVNGAKFAWRCSNCEHHWSAIQLLDPQSKAANSIH